jgi:hypothetical protein
VGEGRVRGNIIGVRTRKCINTSSVLYYNLVPYFPLSLFKERRIKGERLRVKYEKDNFLCVAFFFLCKLDLGSVR